MAYWRCRRVGKPTVGEIIGRIEAGEKPSVSQIKEQIAGAKWAVKRATSTKREGLFLLADVLVIARRRFRAERERRRRAVQTPGAREDIAETCVGPS
jgi:hypothetical protein